MASKKDYGIKIGGLLQKQRKQKDINQAEFGMAVLNRSGSRACQAWVSRIETGKVQTLREHDLLKMAEILEIEPDELLSLWLQYQTADEGPAGSMKSKGRDDGEYLFLSKELMKQYPNLYGYLTSFIMVSSTGDVKAMSSLLEGAASYLRSTAQQQL